jgi:hypothetical protein
MERARGRQPLKLLSQKLFRLRSYVVVASVGSEQDKFDGPEAICDSDGNMNHLISMWASPLCATTNDWGSPLQTSL